MTLAAGSRVGPYRIVRPLGAGGMGEVYRATDTKLGRDVAIKTLPGTLASEPDRLARFEREARLLAALNHPNIAVIYGLEEQDGTLCIAMELIEGETLEEKLRDGPLPIDDTLRLALQIAQALEAAHDKGVVHRDLKPANIIVTPEGTVKVLDFGLAKAFSADPEQSSPDQSPALSLAMTQAGLVLGTAGYMSPEQASGQPTDQRADVWAFGVVLFEMLTGVPLFSGESVPHILADVLKTDPDWSRLPANLHPRLRESLLRCLEKKARNRYHGIADARVDIENALSDPYGGESQSGPAAVASRRPILLWSAATAAVTAAVAALLAWSLWPADAPEPLTRFSFDVPGAFGADPIIALSPDGRRIVVAVNDALYSRRMDQVEPTLIPGSDAGRGPFFSPDGQSVAFFTPGQLKAVGFAGEPPRVLAAIEPAPGLTGAWDSEGRIFFGQQGPYGLSWVPAVGGDPEPFAELADYIDLDYPDALPGGEWILFTAHPTGPWSSSDIAAQHVVTSERRTLLRGGHFARYLPTGHLVFARDGTLFAVAFDAERLQVVGSPVPVVVGVVTSEQGGGALYAVSSNGILAYVGGDGAEAAARTLVWVSRAGLEEPVAAPPRAYNNARISPDGTTVALDIRDQDLDIWTWDFARETLTRLTFDPAEDEFPVWSPDGRRIAFSSTGRDGAESNVSLYWRAADGTGPAERLAGSSGQIFPTSFLPDSTGMLVFGAAIGAGGGDDIGIFRMEGEDRAAPLLETGFEESYPAVSPDGRWMAYVSDESGSEEVYVRPFPDVDTGGRWQVSTGGGTQPLWARDGRELFYRNGRALVAVPVRTDPGLSIGNPEILLEGDYYLGPGGPNYDVAPDGDRFLMIRQGEGASRITVVLNWFSEIERLVPTPR